MTVKRWETIGFFATVLLGILLHFVYHWSGGWWVIGLFAPVNESTWEHMKLILTPVLLFSAIEYFVFGRSISGFFSIKVWSVLLSMGLMIVLFYTYSGIVGQSFLPADVLLFVLGAAAAFRYSERRLSASERICSETETICTWLTFGLLVFCVVFFTFFPPHIGLFADPLTGTYGIPF